MSGWKSFRLGYLIGAGLLEVLLEPEASGGAVGVVCEKGVGWEFGL